MKSLADQMAIYAAYHQDARNKATHFIGVPIIVLSLFIPLAGLRVEFGGVAISAAMLFAAVVVLYYLVLDVPMGFAMAGIFAALLWGGDRIAALGAAHASAWFTALFIGGWILQLLGHVFEGPRPGLAGNPFQIFVGPVLFLPQGVFSP